MRTWLCRALIVGLVVSGAWRLLDWLDDDAIFDD